MKYTIEFELPDNDTVLREIKSACVEWAVWGYSGHAHAQPERKTGHWVEHHEPYTWMGYTHWSCSECGYGEEPENHNRTNYCPNCGARMAERREGET